MTLPRVPIRFIPENKEILEGFSKSVDSGQILGGTDDTEPTIDVLQVKMGQSYRTAPGRSDGNEFFRRNCDGSLALDYAAHKVIDALHRHQEAGELDDHDKLALAFLFPTSCAGLYPSSTMPAQAAVQFRLSTQEILAVRQLVAAHLEHEIAFITSSHAR